MERQNMYLEYPYEATVSYAEGKRELTSEEMNFLNDSCELPKIADIILWVGTIEDKETQKKVLDSVMDFIMNLAITTNAYLDLLEEADKQNVIWIPVESGDCDE